MVVAPRRDVDETQNQLTCASEGTGGAVGRDLFGDERNEEVEKNRKAPPIISDSGDNSSCYTESEVRKMVHANDVLIYAACVYEYGGGCVRTPEEAGGTRLPVDEQAAGHRGEGRRRVARSLRARVHAERTWGTDAEALPPPRLLRALPATAAGTFIQRRCLFG